VELGYLLEAESSVPLFLEVFWHRYGKFVTILGEGAGSPGWPRSEKAKPYYY
jgi:hypothetical protein